MAREAYSELMKAINAKKFVFTGGLSRLSRPEAKVLVESLGARATGSVSKSTDYVVAGEEAGSKLEDARRLGVTVLDEEGFLAMMAEYGVGVAEGIAERGDAQ